jgi:hypothetical protein
VLEQGEACFCALSWSEGLAVPDDHDDAVRRLEATTQFWRRWRAGTRFPDHARGTSGATAADRLAAEAVRRGVRRPGVSHLALVDAAMRLIRRERLGELSREVVD